ncbi:secretion system protein E [Methanosarcina sp. 2.H.T.1A.6]|uniref:type II/IV secretion system ATPase subunit n=1 Tax=unclassified Methanosarcina TaxID=2644672 RepID=UPI000621BE51|nr:MULTISPECIES: type II/IV secretion system ATPase subunit [unclassified Methanosarcina]KKG16335.1 secretion system protein E [Methanosarcina sp. 2.H.T.1A.3]KKG19503.1 secretion system protein E [Methanosarcina sp. 2.H.T.1A.6]KKG21808.1 secretion system protein E [Methanosarcina sp. 2.H.T.1A.8]KKG26876.1 secretion system protein E [Methanosarcina sp. 2.H.T.1A.15]
MEALPFDPLPSPENGGRSREEMYSSLSSEMQEFVDREENHHILDYVCRLPTEEIGFPEFYPRISRSMKGIKRPNLIYPTGKGLAVHIYPDKEDVRNYYIPIEPCLFQKLDSKLEEVEKLLIDVIYDQDITTKDPEEKKKLLEKALEKTCEVRENLKENSGISEGKSRGQRTISGKEKTSLREGSNSEKSEKSEKSGILGNLKEAGKAFKIRKLQKMSLTPEEFSAIKYLMIRDKVGMGVLEPLLLDSNIEDISCSGLGRIFVEHKVFSSLKTTISFEENEELNSFVIQMSEKVGKPITYRDPIVDTALPDGSRINIVFGEDVSKQGSNFTIRKFMGTPISILELIEFGTIDYTMAAYMWMMLRAGMNCFVSGETASGKTTMMNAVTTFLPPESKIVSIEDTPELQVPHKNWTREVTRSTREDSGSDISMFDLLKAALRQRPNEIMIGEIRGVEGNIAFQAMQTGHPVMSTFHAASVEKLIQRLTGDPINVPKNYVDNLNVVIIQSAVNVPGKGLGRRILSINEIVGYDSESQSFNFMDIFKWDPVTDTFKFTGKNNSYLLEHRIAPRMGIPENQVRKIYSELDRRAKILRKIHQAKITNFYDLFNTLIRLEEAGLTS